MTMTNIGHLTTLGSLINTLAAHTQPAAAELNWGASIAETRDQISEYIRPLEEAGLPNFIPGPFESLRRFVGGEDVPLAELASAKTQLEYANNFFRSLNNGGVNGSNGSNGNGEYRARRMTQPVRSQSIVPPSFRAEPVSVSPYGLIARPSDVAEVPTKHVRAAILFTDFSQFSKQSKGAQSKYIIDRLNRYFEALIPIAQKTGGIVNKLVGDAIMAFWIDSSNNSLKAVQAALAMQEATRNLIEEISHEAMRSDGFRTKLAERGKSLADITGTEILSIAREVDPLIPEMKVGINTGWVSYGRLGAKAPYYSEITVIGDAVNTAARMEAGCKPGQICISQATQSDLPEGMFDLSDLGLVEAKNIGMVQAFGVVRENRFYAVDGNTQKATKALHGRENEVQLLTNQFTDSIETHSPRFLMLIGKPGEGKSTIANHFLGRVKSDSILSTDIDVIYARGEDQPEIEPYQVLANALRIRAGVDLGSNQEDGERRKQRRIENEMKVRALIESAFTGTTKDRGLASEILGHFLETPFESRSDQMAFIVSNHADLNARTIETIVDLFEGLARRRPVILVVDDMQWTDLGTRETMHALLTRLSDSPLFVLGMRRPETTDPFPIDEPDWESVPTGGKIVALEPLKTNDLHSIVHDILGSGVDPVVANDILERASHNPLFVGEIALAMKGGMSLDAMPTTVQNLFQAQLTRLPDEPLELLKRAAIVGRDFSDTDLVALGIAEPDHLLPSLIEGDFITKVAPGEYRFRHDLLRESLCGASHPDRRKEFPGMMEEEELKAYHGVFASFLVKSGSQQYAKIASHYLQAGNTDVAAKYYFQAAEAAASQGAFQSAAHYYEKTFDLSTDRLEKSKALFGWDDVLVAAKKFKDELPLLEKLESLVLDQQGHDRDFLAMVSYHKAQALAQNGKIEESEAEMERALKEYRADDDITKERCDLLHLRCAIRRRFESDKGIVEADEEHLKVALALSDAKRLGIAFVDVAGTDMNRGNYAESLEHFSEAMKLLRPFGESERMYLRALNGVSTALFLMGEFDQALALARDGLNSLKNLKGYSYELDLLNITFAQAAIYSGKYVDRAIAALNEAADRSRGSVVSFIDSYIYIFLAMAYEANKEWEKSKESAEIALKYAQQLDAETHAAMAFTILCRSYRGLGLYEDALKLSAQAVAIYRKVGGVPQFETEVLLTHIEALIGNQQQQEASIFAVEAKSLVEERARRITNANHRKAFLHSWPNSEVISLSESLRVLTTRKLPEQVRTIIQGLRIGEVDQIPARFEFLKGTPAAVIRVSKDEKHSTAATLLDMPVMDVLASVLTKEFKIDENPGDFIKGIWAEDITWRPFFSRDGVMHARVSWNVTGKGVAKKLILALFGEHGHGNVLLQDRIYERDGGVVIELQRTAATEVVSSTQEVVRIDPNYQPRTYQFGKISFVLVPQSGNRTLLALEMETALYTQNPENFLDAFLRAMGVVRPK